MPEKDNRQKFNSQLWRDHSANQRTYLSWMRSAIALMGFGMVILRLQTLPDGDFPLGWLLGLPPAIFGLLTVMIATGNYFLTRRAIDTHTYEPAGFWIILFSGAVVCFGGGILYFLLTSVDNTGFVYMSSFD
ncbi:MAG: hypothetical protein N5P05_003697 [Chroococcopsis gigantea SAG 12.99]|jgi:putative membrane protein|nr:hypothetical protein [Chroococcopsis gigantea SAG 12.99]